MTEANENEKKWREEFEKDKPFSTPKSLNHELLNKEVYWTKRKADGEYFYAHVQVAWLGYLAACKRRQEENDGKDKVIADFTRRDVLHSDRNTALRAENEKLSEVNQGNEEACAIHRHELEALKKENERLDAKGKGIDKEKLLKWSAFSDHCGTTAERFIALIEKINKGEFDL